MGRLATLLSEAKLPSAEDFASQPSTSARRQLISAASDCAKIHANVAKIADRFVAEPNNKASPGARQPLALFFRSMSGGPDSPWYVIGREMKEIENQFEVVWNQAIDSVLLCLW